MSSTFGVAGTAPLADYASRIPVLLMNGIKNSWDSVVYDNVTPPLPYPNVANNDIIFGTEWFYGASDIELIFRLSFEDIPTTLRGSSTTDGRYQQHIVTVDLHVGIRSAGEDLDSSMVNPVLNAIDKIISLNHTTLIPNAIVTMSSIQTGPTEKVTDRQTWFHKLVKTRTVFWKVRSC